MISKEKTDFVEKVQQGRWFRFTNRYGQTMAVKVKSIFPDSLQMLWLSCEDPESMAFEVCSGNEWNIVNKKLSISSSCVYQFGLPEGTRLIYTEENEIDETKLRELILNSEFVSENEWTEVWDALKAKNVNFEPIEFSN